jgi:TadE-like protein
MTGAGRSIRGCTRGAAAVEFAIISMVLIGLLVATIDFGRTLYVKNQISALADQAMRKVLIDPSISGDTLESELRDDFYAGDSAELTFDVDDETVDGIAYRVVTIGYPMTLFIPGLSSDAVSLSVTRRVPAG